MLEENVPHDEWLTMLEESRALGLRARRHPQLWARLGPLNAKIRRLSLLPTTKNSRPIPHPLRPHRG